MNNSDISYMERTRQYYRAQGYTSDYQWAHFETTPFSKPAKTLRESRVAIITTAMPSEAEHRCDRQVESIPVNPAPKALFTDHLSWDKDNTHTRDVPSFLPIEQLSKLVTEGTVGELGRRFFCVPTEYSKRLTLEGDAPKILELCREDQIDLALLVPL